MPQNAENHPGTHPGRDVFEGADHVLHGIRTQIDYWNALPDRDAQKQAMLPALRAAAEALSAGLQRAKAQQGAIGTQA